MLKLNDIVAFFEAFTAQISGADLQPEGLFDLADLAVSIDIVIDMVTAACPSPTVD